MSAPALNATTSASATLSSRSPITNNNTTNNETGDDSNGTEVFRFSMSGTAPIGTMGIVGTWAMKRKEGETLWNGECCPPRADGRICPPQRLINDIAAKFPGITDLNDQENATKAFISYAGHNMRNWKRGRFHLSYDSTKETTNQEHKADLTTHPCEPHPLILEFAGCCHSCNDAGLIPEQPADTQLQGEDVRTDGEEEEDDA